MKAPSLYFQKWPAAHVSSPLNFLRLLTSRLPDSKRAFGKKNVVWRSFQRTRKARINHLFSTSTVTDDTESRKQLQCSAKARKCLDSPSRQLKNEGEKCFPRFARTDRHFTPLFTPFGSGRTTPKQLAPALLHVQCTAVGSIYVKLIRSLVSWKVD